MSEPVLELLLWILLAFFVGCILGCILKMAFGPRTAAATSAREMPVPALPAETPRRAPPSPRPKAPQRPAKPKTATAAETAPKAERKTEAAADKPERKPGGRGHSDDPRRAAKRHPRAPGRTARQAAAGLRHRTQDRTYAPHPRDLPLRPGGRLDRGPGPVDREPPEVQGTDRPRKVARAGEASRRWQRSGIRPYLRLGRLE